MQKLFANCKECQCEKSVEKINVMKLFEPKLTPATDVMKDLSHLSHGSGAELVSSAFFPYVCGTLS